MAALASWKAGDQSVAEMVLAPPPLPPPACDVTRLAQGDIGFLIDALGATSAWVSEVACHVLMQARDPAVGGAVAQRMPDGPDPSRRRNAAIVIVANDPDSCPGGPALLDSGDPPVRVGAAAASRILAGHSGTGPWDAVITRALADDDLTVRLACRDDADTRGAVFWSCPRCAQHNDITASSCVSCRHGKALRVHGLPRTPRELPGIPAG